MGFRRSVLRSAPLALGLLSLPACGRADRRPASPSTDGTVPAVEVPATRPSALPAQSVAPTNPSPPNTQALFDSGEWVRFKSIWRELDAYDAPATTNVSADPIATIPHDKSRALREEVAKLGTSMKGSVGEPAAIELLVRVTDTRIDNLSGMRMRFMMSHVGPMPGDLAVADAVGDLEKRIDTLLALRSRGKVDGKARDAALTAIREEIEFTGLLQALGRRMSYAVPTREHHNVSELQAAIAARAAAAPADGGASDELLRFKAEVDKAAETIARVRPWLESMVADLER
jgi:hypothetical protein